MKSKRGLGHKRSHYVMFVILLLSTFFIGLPDQTIFGKERTTIRFATFRSTKAELNLFEATIKEFEAVYPNIHVEVEPISFKDQQTFIISAIAAHSEPEVVTLLAPMVPHYAISGNLLPLTDVFNELGGKNDFYPIPIKLVTLQDNVYGIVLNTNGPVHWFRKDLLVQKRLQPPRTWEDLLHCAKTLTQDTDGDGKIDSYGTVVPYGRSSMTAWYFEALLWSNGGRIFDNDLKVVFNSRENIETLNFMKELAKYSPPGSAQYSFAETMNTFTVGKAATTWYWGRLLNDVEQKNPSLSDKIGAVLISKKNKVYKGGMDSIGIMKNSPHPELGKKFLKFFLQSDHYISFLHAPAGQFFPSRKSIAHSKSFLSHPLLSKHPDIIKVLQEAAANTAMFTIEPGGVVNPYANNIETAHIIEDVVQRVLILGESPDKALAWGEERMNKIVSELKEKERRK